MAWTSPSLASVARSHERDTPCHCPAATITVPDWLKVPDTGLLPGCKADLKRLSRRRRAPQRGWTRGLSIPLRAIEPDDVHAPWFVELSPWLTSTRVEAECAVGAWRQKCTVSALTALTLLQRREGPCDGAAVFFRADAGNIAGDIRRRGLGRVWGQCTAQLVLHDTLWDVVAGGEMGLLEACADVLVGYIAQLDKAQLDKDNVSHRVEAARDLTVYNYEWPGEDRYVQDGVRAGIVYGAVVGYLSDLWGDGPSMPRSSSEDLGDMAAGLVSVGEITVERADPRFMDDGEWREELDEVIFWFNEEMRGVEHGWGSDAGATADDIVRFRSTAAATFVRLAQREGVLLSNRIAPETPLVHSLPDANVYRYGSNTTTSPLLRLPEFTAPLLAATRRAQ